MCKLAGPQHKEFRKEILQTMQVGWDDEINFAKISFLSHSHWHLRSLNVQLEYMYNNIKHAVKRSQSIQTDFAHRVFLI
ncbi:hypothetical protein SAST42_04360 [Staphylococcus aureus]|nr:hypothetical protein SAST42_04360 [Staphylococcus aureus]AMV86399.1 hypothetical protein SAST43_04614 [Staphylococcus aureus]